MAIDLAMRQMLTVAETADILQLHPVTLARFIREGKFPAIKVGKASRVPAKAVRQMLGDWEQPCPNAGNGDGKATH